MDPPTSRCAWPGDNRGALDRQGLAQQGPPRILAPGPLAGQDQAADQRGGHPGRVHQPGYQSEVRDLLGMGDMADVVGRVEAVQAIARRATAGHVACRLRLRGA